MSVSIRGSPTRVKISIVRFGHWYLYIAFFLVAFGLCEYLMGVCELVIVRTPFSSFGICYSIVCLVKFLIAISVLLLPMWIQVSLKFPLLLCE